MRSDGTFFSSRTFTDISSVFNPDGSLLQGLAPPYPAGKFPMSGTVPIVSPDGKLYYWESAMIVPMDSNLTPLAPIDIYGRGGYNDLTVPAVGSTGKIYSTKCAGYSVYDSTGAVTENHATYFDTAGQQFIGGCHLFVNSSNNPVIYGRIGSGDVLVADYDQSGNPLHHAHVPPQFGNNPSIVSESNGKYLVHFADQLGELDSTFQLAQTLFSPDPTWGTLAGIDAGGNYYFQSVPQGTAGPNPGTYRVCDHNGQIIFSEGESDFSAGSHTKYNQAHIYRPHAATSDPSNGSVYIADGRGIVVYQNGAYVESWPNAGGNSIAFSPTHEIYATSNQGATVFDLTGNIVRTLTYPQILSGMLMVDIAIDESGNKYLYDSGSGVIHKIAPNDSYEKLISLPSGDLNGNARGIATTPDGNLIYTATNPSDASGVLVQKVTTDGSLIWSVPAKPKVYGGFPRVDSSGRIYIGSLVLDSAGQKLSDVGFAMNVITPFGSHVVMVSDWTIYELSAD